ncbi:MAG TPA: hypothetical protein VI565_00400 [Burkholderiales bacterium]|nr:MAG: hypothetical protein A2W26_10985 [Acidobacteria bacterium RBG_16_64_8]HLF22350.1 hypothetical protein [Burkholderiales bacterium]
MTQLTAITNDTTSALVSLALNAAMAKHAAIAQNIANANNDGYRPVQVDFDRQVALFKEQLLNRDNDGAAGRAIDGLSATVRITEAPESSVDKVRIDAEVAKMTQNAVHYQALLAAHGKMAGLLRLAINGGR